MRCKTNDCGRAAVKDGLCFVCLPADLTLGADPVNHPAHYTRGPMEVIDIIDGFGLGFCLGNVVKYVLRAGHKGSPLEDLRKAAWYLQREIADYEKVRPASPLSQAIDRAVSKLPAPEPTPLPDLAPRAAEARLWTRRAKATPEQLAAFLVDFSKKHGCAPRRVDVARGLGYAEDSKGAIDRLLRKARTAGVVTWDEVDGKMVFRSLRVVSRATPGQALNAKASIDDLCKFIEEYRARNGVGPTGTEIGRRFNYSASGGKAVTELLRRARVAGRVMWDRSPSGQMSCRSVRLAEQKPAPMPTPVLTAPPRPVPVHGQPDMPAKIDQPSLPLPFTNGAHK